MQWLACAELASAVSNAGGLGIIAAGSFPTAEELRQEIRKVKNLTDKPFAVNFTLMPTRRPIVDTIGGGPKASAVFTVG